MNQFNREIRYLVAKIKDVEYYLTPNDKTELYRILDKLEEGRIRNGRRPLHGVVVEQDWPEFEKVWGMIAGRHITTEPEESGNVNE